MNRLLRRKSPVVQSLIEMNAELSRRLAEVCTENLKLTADLAGTFQSNDTLWDCWQDANAENERLRARLREMEAAS